ncbi:hypothetical protein G6F56_013264 [Rhizopus delemar]|nr:hypothetical protein G6F56_013264 [Rhizopus delemar]
MGPEILSYKKYDAKADLWSVGAVLYETVTGDPPFRAQNHVELLHKITHNTEGINFPDPNTGKDLQDLIRRLLQKEPAERISFEEFFQHPAIQLIKKQQLPSRHYIKTSSTTNDYEPPPFAQLSPNRKNY